MTQRLQQLLAWAQIALADAGVQIEALIADASTRRYVRLRSGEDTYIVMDAPDQSATITQFISVDRLLGDADVNVPEICASDAQLGFVLMSDFGAETYLQAVESTKAGPLYEQAIDTLIALQSEADRSELPPYDKATLMREMRLFPEWFLGRHLELVLAPADAQALESCFHLLTEYCSAQPVTFVHRDYHSRNLMHVPTRNPGVLDFQDALQGPISYDLVSLLRDVYVEWPDKQVKHWLDYYLQNSPAVADTVSPTDFQQWFDWMGLQRHLKIAGLFSRLHYRDNKPNYLPDVARTLKYIGGVCERYDELAELHSLLERLDIRALHQHTLDAIGVAS